MAINKKLIHFKNKADFLLRLDKGDLLDTSIVFILDSGEIWTHGKFYDGSGNSIIPFDAFLEEVTYNDLTESDTFLDTTNSFNVIVFDNSNKIFLGLDTANHTIHKNFYNYELYGTFTKGIGVRPHLYGLYNYKDNGKLYYTTASYELQELLISKDVTVLKEKLKNAVTGVKGNSETSYRTGNINITKANIGLGNVDNTSDINKPVSTAQSNAISAAINSLDSSVTSTNGKNVQVRVIETNGKITSVQIPTDNTASNADVQNAYDALNDKIDIVGRSLSSTQADFKNHKNNVDKKHIPEGGSESQILTWKADGEAQWKDPSSVFTGLEETLAYGVEWDTSLSDPEITRIGNMSLHKTLPILSLLRGCIALGNQIMYWLDDHDWHFKAGEKTALMSSIIVYNTSNYISWNLSYLRYEINAAPSSTLKQHIPSGSYVCMFGGDNTRYYAYLSYNTSKIFLTDLKNSIGLTPTDEEISTNMLTALFIGTPSRLDGYDGTVRIYCPSFYIKSKTYPKNQVWLSTVKIDDTWTYLPEILIDAYKCTVLNSVPNNMGYLSTLPVNSAVSIVNSLACCRGGNNNSAYDKYLSTDSCRTQLGKPRTNVNRPTMRTYARNAGSELLSYELYKNIFYWLYVVEYANFDSLATFNEALTSEDYHQGGLGNGVVGWGYTVWKNYNQNQPLTPCGFTSDSGNTTCVKNLITKLGTDNLDNGTTNVPSTTFSIAKWRGFENVFGDLWTNLDGILIDTPISGLEMPTYYIITNSNNYTDDLEGVEEKATRIVTSYNSDGIIKEWKLGNDADIIPLSVAIGAPNVYKCDKFTVTYKDSIKTLLVGGGVNDGADNAAGLGWTFLLYTPQNQSGLLGYRTVSTSVSFPDKV